jgi:hypothetical protein
MKDIANKKMALISGVVLFVVGVVLSSALLAQTERKATIVLVDGVADVQKAGTTQWVPAQKGMEIASGDTLRTTLDSMLDVRLDDGSVLRLKEETQVTLEALASEKESARFLYFFGRPVEAQKAKLKLAEGEVMAHVTKLPNSQSSFQVETPKGVAGVRGTSWGVGTKKLYVQEGFIDWKAKNPKGGTVEDFLDWIAKMIGGRKSVGNPGTNIPEGFTANQDKDGNIKDMEVLKRELLDEIRDLQIQNYGGTIDTQANRNNVSTVAEQQIGGTGGAGGDVRAEAGTGKLPDNAAEVHQAGADAPGVDISSGAN